MKMSLSPLLKAAFQKTWSAIGPDCFAAMSGCGESVTLRRSEVIEMVLDCERVEEYGCPGGTPEDREDFKKALIEFRTLSIRKQDALAVEAFPDKFYCM